MNTYSSAIVLVLKMCMYCNAIDILGNNFIVMQISCLIVQGNTAKGTQLNRTL